MAGFTKKAIRDSFVRLLNQKPLSQITVRDIVDDCHINRNTFYYHFQDIPQLLVSIVDEEAERIIREYPTIGSIEECLSAVIGFALENRTAIMHIYHSTSRDIYEQYQWRTCEHVVTLYIDGILAGRSVSAQDRDLIIDYLKCLCFGIIMGWLEEGMHADIQARFHRICVLRRDDFERLIAQCEASREK